MAKVKKKSKPKTHKCPHCSKRLSDKYSLDHHLQLHSDDKPFACTKCNATFKTKKYVSKHLRRVHKKATGHECEFCGKKFHFESLLQKHRLVHTDERPYKCKWCKKGFNSRYTLSGHILIHTNSKPFKCSYCEYSCRDSSTLRRHEERHRGQVPTYSCKICEKRFCKKSLLRYHVTEAHLNIDVKVVPCETCGKMFRNATALKVHVNQVHRRIFATKCAVCDRVVSSKHNMQQHMRSHVDLRPYTCTFDACGKTFKDKTALKKHEIIHYPDKQFKCKLCDRLFTRKHRLDRHKLQHKLKKKSVICDYCGVSFYNKSYLSNHIKRKHLHTERFVCDICDLVTYSKPGLIMHLKYHMTETDTQCRLCKKTYKTHASLKLHYWNTHCIQYKKRSRNIKKKQKELLKIDEDELDAVIKKEVASEDDTEYSKAVQAEEQNKARKGGATSEQPLEELFVKHILDRNQIPKKAPDPNLDQVMEETVQKKIRKLIRKSRRKKERIELEKVRRRYNRRMEMLMKKKEATPVEVESKKSEVTKIICEKDENGKLKFNVHQCYVCFTLCNSKEELLDHCQTHFDVCNATMLRKCPLCDFVSKISIKAHLKKSHNINIRMYTGNIKDKKSNSDGSRFYFDVKSKRIDKLEVIPSVKLLNRAALVELDRKNRESKDKIIATTKLVKKGEEWVVERRKMDLENYFIPKLNVEIPSNGDYCARMRALSVAAKKSGGKMLFPCDQCEKICRTLSALKLHIRRHDPNSKPFKPKVWKHKSATNTDNTKTTRVDSMKRYIKPKPIVSKHKCDPDLIKFYESNVRGDNIEFWQFLKIYNRMTKERVEDFSDLEKRIDFGIHTSISNDDDTGNGVSNNNETVKDIARTGKSNVKKCRKLKTAKVIRRILISKKEHERRNEIKKQMRETIVKMANDKHNIM
ncbi:unnamed protein product [Leptosia nina]|uniref:C2H2-type domain-containing protein n=1 Tax=Leptosia nina TaxID=320188 RepID=A0AAV1JYE9_9NEOP